MIYLTQEVLRQACVIVLGWEVVRMLDAEVVEGGSLLWVWDQTKSYSACISVRCFPLLIIYREREKVKYRITVSLHSLIGKLYFKNKCLHSLFGQLLLQVPLQALLYDHADIGLRSASPKQWKKGGGNILATIAGKIIKEKVTSKLKWCVHCSTENDPPIYARRREGMNE